jgi:hypothetical protein
VRKWLPEKDLRRGRIVRPLGPEIIHKMKTRRKSWIGKPLGIPARVGV